MGLSLAVAIAMHNIPGAHILHCCVHLRQSRLVCHAHDRLDQHDMQVSSDNLLSVEGVAVALPVYFATKSRWTGFKYAFLSGMPHSLLCALPANSPTCQLRHTFTSRSDSLL